MKIERGCPTEIAQSLMPGEIRVEDDDTISNLKIKISIPI